MPFFWECSLFVIKFLCSFLVLENNFTVEEEVAPFHLSNHFLYPLLFMGAFLHTLGVKLGIARSPGLYVDRQTHSHQQVFNVYGVWEETLAGSKPPLGDGKTQTALCDTFKPCSFLCVYHLFACSCLYAQITTFLTRRKLYNYLIWIWGDW